ncbi:hypothetical protein EYF80_052196 [Liparis tanakae]|uniref:Uncharacterized protein n=1 Tax=Liparis tanakae TaxID=230148 RepID=A0A4Z2F8S4_9TELE|nr:hypothetical protein EYF80_052196 [Liparis tanakae]
MLYPRLALPLLFFCVPPFFVWGGGWTASFTASSQKPRLALWVSPQMLLESEPQLEQMLVFTEPHTELLRDDVCVFWISAMDRALGVCFTALADCWPHFEEDGSCGAGTPFNKL